MKRNRERERERAPERRIRSIPVAVLPVASGGGKIVIKNNTGQQGQDEWDKLP
jgi:hypothetical protein